MSRTSLVAAAIAALFISGPALAQTVSLEAASTAAVGSRIEVHWTAAAEQADFVSIDEAGAPDDTYGPYDYPSNGNPLQLEVPTEPGNYEIRYHSGASGYAVLAKRSLVVTDVTATLEVPSTVDVGGNLRVTWTGPNNPGDFISIDAVDAADHLYGPYAYPANGNPVEVQAPDQPGEYLVRYHLAGSYRVIGRAPVQVGGVTATVEAPASVPAGSMLPVQWTGPGRQGDFISIDAVGADDRSYGNYEYPQRGNPVEIRVPDEPGEYLVRYHLDSSYSVLVSRPLAVEAVTASLSAPGEVAARSIFNVGWEGPNNEGDFITIVVPTAKDREYGASNGYTQRGNPVRLEAPREAGRYELRYLTGQSYRTIATRPLAVVPSAAPAQLRVVSDGQPAGGTFAAVEFVLDASGSMLQRLEGVRRIELAKAALTDLARDVLPDGTRFALRVFGHKEAGSCRTDLELPLAAIDRGAAVARINSLNAMNLAKTPIGASLLKVRDDLQGVTGPMLVVLVTDGEETCGGDPKAAIQALRSAGLDVRVNIVGFAVDEVVLKETFRDWARAGNGGYFDAQSGDELRKAVRATLQSTYQVVAGDDVVATGTVNGDALEVPSGTYHVRVLGATANDLGEVTLGAGEAKDLKY